MGVLKVAELIPASLSCSFPGTELSSEFRHGHAGSNLPRAASILHSAQFVLNGFEL